MSGAVYLGKGSDVSFIAPHALLDDFHHVLSYLLDDDRIEPQQIVDALACIASIVKHVGPPITVIKNPYKDPQS